MQFMHHLECAITFDHACATARYDEGCTAITNIDFSKPVIKEMMAKNLRKRPLMKWQVMDMTQTRVRQSLRSSAARSSRALLPHPHACRITINHWP